MLNTKKLLTKILDAIKVDYVKAEGTSGSWKYREWNSGKYECWYRATIDGGNSYAMTTSKGSLYVGAWKTVQYPITFAESPTTAVMCNLSNENVIGIQAKEAFQASISLRGFASASLSTNSLTVQIYACGTKPSS